MEIVDLKTKYSHSTTCKPAKLFARAVRAEIAGGANVVAINTLLYEAWHGRRHLRDIINIVQDDVSIAYAMMRNEIARRYGMSVTEIMYVPYRPAPSPRIVGYVPVWCAWHKLAEMDIRTLAPAELDLATDVRLRLQETLNEMER